MGALMSICPNTAGCNKDSNLSLFIYFFILVNQYQSPIIPRFSHVIIIIICFAFFSFCKIPFTEKKKRVEYWFIDQYSFCSDDHHNQSPRNNNHYGNRDLQSMLDMGLDEEGCIEESGGHVSEKKRRLSVEQVKALEKNFEVENKLEPERKVKLAQELGLQPRQVAVWFQNRRARWKTKQLERDYAHLKADYEALKTSYDSLQHDNQTLINEVQIIQGKIINENRDLIVRIHISRSMC